MWLYEVGDDVGSAVGSEVGLGYADANKRKCAERKTEGQWHSSRKA